MLENYIHMGSFGRPHGISGEIVLDWYGVSPFSCTMHFCTEALNKAPVPLCITSSRRHNGRLLIRVQGVTNRDQAAQLTGQKLLLKRSDLPEPGQDEAYISDLKGASVVLEDGTELGCFSHLLQGTGGSVWSIRAKDGREILFPAEPAFIAELDVQHQRIVIAPPEGLLELYLSD